jgi:hypothetical protein
MTREQKCQLAIEKGYTYNPETGKIFNRFGKEMNSKHISKYNNDETKHYITLKIYYDKTKYVQIYGHQFAWYWVNKECVKSLDHINRIKNDNRIINLRSVSHLENCKNRIFKK